MLAAIRSWLSGGPHTTRIVKPATPTRGVYADMSPAAFRALENIPARRPLPAWLSHTTPYTDLTGLTDHLHAAARQAGLGPLRALTIMWPHKHPRYHHGNRADYEALVLQGRLRAALPRVTIHMAHAIYERHHLDRSSNQTAAHALTGVQDYAVDPALQSAETLPFIEAASPGPHAVILTDWCVDQGTTMANLASFAAHNGGVVLAVAPPYGQTALRPDAEARDKLRRAFARAAAGLRETAPSAESCAALFATALARHGRTPDSLTAGEMRRISGEVEGNPNALFGIVNKLGIGPQAQRRFLAEHTVPPRDSRPCATIYP